MTRADLRPEGQFSARRFRISLEGHTCPISSFRTREYICISLSFSGASRIFLPAPPKRQSCRIASLHILLDCWLDAVTTVIILRRPQERGCGCGRASHPLQPNNFRRGGGRFNERLTHPTSNGLRFHRNSITVTHSTTQ